MEKPKNKPAKKAPETGPHTDVTGTGFWETKSAYPHTLDGTNQRLRMGVPQDNTNAGNPQNAKAMQKKKGKSSGRKTRNLGRV